LFWFGLGHRSHRGFSVILFVLGGMWFRGLCRLKSEWCVCSCVCMSIGEFGVCQISHEASRRGGWVLWPTLSLYWACEALFPLYWCGKVVSPRLRRGFIYSFVVAMLIRPLTRPLHFLVGHCADGSGHVTLRSSGVFSLNCMFFMCLVQ